MSSFKWLISSAYFILFIPWFYAVGTVEYVARAGVSRRSNSVRDSPGSGISANYTVLGRATDVATSKNKNSLSKRVNPSDDEVLEDADQDNELEEKVQPLFENVGQRQRSLFARRDKIRGDFANIPFDIGPRDRQCPADTVRILDRFPNDIPSVLLNRDSPSYRPVQLRESDSRILYLDTWVSLTDRHITVMMMKNTEEILHERYLPEGLFYCWQAGSNDEAFTPEGRFFPIGLDPLQFPPAHPYFISMVGIRNEETQLLLKYAASPQYRHPFPSNLPADFVSDDSVKTFRYILGDVFGDPGPDRDIGVHRLLGILGTSEVHAVNIMVKFYLNGIVSGNQPLSNPEVGKRAAEIYAIYFAIHEKAGDGVDILVQLRYPPPIPDPYENKLLDELEQFQFSPSRTPITITTIQNTPGFHPYAASLLHLGSSYSPNTFGLASYQHVACEYKIHAPRDFNGLRRPNHRGEIEEDQIYVIDLSISGVERHLVFRGMKHLPEDPFFDDTADGSLGDVIFNAWKQKVGRGPISQIMFASLSTKAEIFVQKYHANANANQNQDSAWISTYDRSSPHFEKLYEEFLAIPREGGAFSTLVHPPNRGYSQIIGHLYAEVFQIGNTTDGEPFILASLQTGDIVGLVQPNNERGNSDIMHMDDSTPLSDDSIDAFVYGGTTVEAAQRFPSMAHQALSYNPDEEELANEVGNILMKYNFGPTRRVNNPSGGLYQANTKSSSFRDWIKHRSGVAKALKVANRQKFSLQTVTKKAPTQLGYEVAFHINGEKGAGFHLVFVALSVSEDDFGSLNQPGGLCEPLFATLEHSKFFDWSKTHQDESLFISLLQFTERSNLVLQEIYREYQTLMDDVIFLTDQAVVNPRSSKLYDQKPSETSGVKMWTRLWFLLCGLPEVAAAGTLYSSWYRYINIETSRVPGAPTPVDVPRKLTGITLRYRPAEKDKVMPEILLIFEPSPTYGGELNGGQLEVALSGTGRDFLSRGEGMALYQTVAGASSASGYGDLLRDDFFPVSVSNIEFSKQFAVMGSQAGRYREVAIRQGNLASQSYYKFFLRNDGSHLAMVNSVDNLSESTQDQVYFLARLYYRAWANARFGIEKPTLRLITILDGAISPVTRGLIFEILTKFFLLPRTTSADRPDEELIRTVLTVKQASENMGDPAMIAMFMLFGTAEISAVSEMTLLYSATMGSDTVLIISQIFIRYYLRSQQFEIDVTLVPAPKTGRSRL
ncbi:hypothetical protein Dda_5869 [Drechslerella dactyloides]|uniref:Uncharacterized protein n=1 Tax=Drechslerella dactyloides TaxID=74499 RepID=A0AAD6IUM5_DREDA|nr:hypothetical protein Dda_5869 [Drechslerella dactyloides]